MFENTEWAIKNGQSRDTSNIKQKTQDEDNTKQKKQNTEN